MSPKRTPRRAADEVIVMTVHQCPRCPLRFSFRTELEFHLREDHGRDSDAASARESREPVGSPASSALNERAAAPMIATATSRPLPELTLMPRRVVVAVIGIVIAVLGLGLLFGS
jgi:hypothetical protein